MALEWDTERLIRRLKAHDKDVVDEGRGCSNVSVEEYPIVVGNEIAAGRIDA